MRTTIDGINLTARNQHVRMCIAMTLIDLLAVKEMETITITELVKKANVSRMTFYKYYKSKQEVLSDYMYELMSEYMEEANNRSDIGSFGDLKHICHCFEFFRHYSRVIQILIQSNMYSVIINTVNSYMEQYVSRRTEYSAYELYYYAGALCNTYIKWIEFGMKESPEQISELVYRKLER